MHRGIVSLLTLVLCTDASAAASNSISPSDETLHAATIERDPLGFRGADGAPQGVAVDVYRVVADRLGRSLDVTFASADEIVRGFLAGTIDVAVMFPRRELIGVAQPFGPIIEVATGVLTPKPLARYEDLAGMRVGYVRDTLTDARFEADATITKVSYDSAADVFDAYVGGAVDAVTGPLQYLFYQAPEFAARKDALFHVLPLQNRRMWLYVRAAAFDDAERAVLEQTVAEMVEANMVESFSDHYFGTRATVP